MGYNGGMDNLNLFTLLLACATFLLAGAAFWTILQNYIFRNKERKRIIKERALIGVRNFVKEAVELMLLNMKYKCEYNKPELNYGRPTLENIQISKCKLVRDFEDTLISAQLWPDLFTLVDESCKILSTFVREGMAENPDLSDEYIKTYLTQFANITALTRHIEREDSDMQI